ncbi:MAG TPA: hypothetical protein VFM18_24080, partial [Methanosarcina sp.]|nr:hypothetical protein [Methanosarcina sp.]
FLAQYGSKECVNEIMKQNPSEMDTDVRLSLASNQHLTPEHIDSLLATNKILTTRRLASNPNLESRHYDHLLKDSDNSVKLNMAKNPKTPEHILNVLKNDTHHLVKLNAEQNLEDRKK